MDLDQLLFLLVKENASDLHLKVGTPPIMRKFGKLLILDSKLPPINNQTIDQLMQPILNDSYQKTLKQSGSVDIGYGVKGLGRFRLNIFYQRGSMRAVIRHIPHHIPTVEELCLPEQYTKIIDQTERGLVLICGATGSGKSTTLAALINHINHTKCKHILTIEDPIEFLIKDRHCLITQREIGIDCKDPITALKASLRQDPDIILFSEIRSKESIKTALLAAETGHLVFSTIHTQDAAETINRMTGAFNKEEQLIIRPILANTLKVIFAQRLICRATQNGYIPACEILINTERMRKSIEQQESTQKIRQIMQESIISYGMQTFNHSISQLIKKGLITTTEAYRYATNSNNLKMSLSGINHFLLPEQKRPEPLKTDPNISTLQIQEASKLTRLKKQSS